MSRFTAPNGQSVEKIVTTAGGTVYLDTSVSDKLLNAMRIKVRARLAEIDKERAMRSSVIDGESKR